LEYKRTCGEVSFSFQEVLRGISGGDPPVGTAVRMPKYISWDNVIDMFLSR
jgi:hypothetical protein